VTEFEYRHRVRYRECDPMGLVYHTHYLDYFEAARTEALRSLGVAYADLEQGGIIMPVVDLAVRYHASARYDDQLIITSDFGTEIPGARVRIEYRISREGEEAVLVTGHVTLCFVDVARGRPVGAPESVRTALQKALDT
jgi:acyl-CoA thioester hydrolase